LKVEELKELKKGDFIFVWWLDASEMRGTLTDHDYPEIHVCDWGVFLGVTGREKKHIVLASSFVDEDKSWAATRIPVDLVIRIDRAWPREEVQKHIDEVKRLRRKIYVRRCRVHFYRLTPGDTDALI